jgi:hypothetical protein
MQSKAIASHFYRIGIQLAQIYASTSFTNYYQQHFGVEPIRVLYLFRDYLLKLELNEL